MHCVRGSDKTSKTLRKKEIISQEIISQSRHVVVVINKPTAMGVIKLIFSMPHALQPGTTGSCIVNLLFRAILA